MNDLCSIDRIKLALRGSLSSEDETALAEHLEHCDACGTEMESLAAEPAFRRDAADLLVGDVFDEEQPSDQWSLVDFAVEYLEPSDDPSFIGRLSGYGVTQVIGRGGMGVVLRAFDPDLKRQVAIKVLAPHLAPSAVARKRFAREAQAAAAVVHPHVLAIHQVQPGGRLPFFVMSLISGESLAERLASQGHLDLKETLRIGMQAAAGLAAAHQQGLVHRDVKPANILLERGVERAVLTDFGLARAVDDLTMTRWGMIAGTPQYMSPEQARGETLDVRSDLFSLGCVLYEMATGVSPFKADSTIATLRRLIDDRPQPMSSLQPDLPRWFVQIVERLLEKDPAKRFASASEVSDLLASCLAHVQQPTSVPLPREAQSGAEKGHRLSPFAGATGKRGLWVVFGAMSLFVTIGGIFLSGLLSVSEKDAKAQSEKNLKRISDALLRYRKDHDDRFPPAVIYGSDGKGGPPHSWRVALLPYLGHQDRYDAYRFDEPWDSPHNKALLARMPEVYRAPFDNSTNTSYFGVVLAGHSSPQPISLASIDSKAASTPNSEKAEQPRAPDAESIMGMNPFEAPRAIRQADRKRASDVIAIAERWLHASQEITAQSDRLLGNPKKPQRWGDVTTHMTLFEAKARLAELDGNPTEQLQHLQRVYLLTMDLLQQAFNGDYVFATKDATLLRLAPQVAEVRVRMATLKPDANEQIKFLDELVKARAELAQRARDAHIDPKVAEQDAAQAREWLATARANAENINGTRTVVSSLNGMKYGAIADGAANTIAIVEAKQATPWTKPEDIVFDPKSEAMQLGGWYRSGWFAVFADQSVRWFANDIDPDEVRNLLTVFDPDGGPGKAAVKAESTPLQATEVLGLLMHFPNQDTRIVNELRKMSPKQFEAATVQQQLLFQKMSDPNGQTSYYLPTKDGHTVIVMYRGNEFAGVQRVRGEHPVGAQAVWLDKMPAMVGGPGIEVTGTTVGNVWGTLVYTSDSNLAAAATHAGLVAVGEKQVIFVEVVASPNHFIGSTCNGVTSMSFGEYPTAIRLHKVRPPVESSARSTMRFTPSSLEPVKNREPSRPPATLGELTIVVVTGSSKGNVWGTHVYTDDSDLATAAVHAGLASVGEKRMLCVEVVDAPDSFVGSTRNGVVSSASSERRSAIRLSDISFWSANRSAYPPIVDPPQVVLPAPGKMQELLAEKPGTVVVMEVTGEASSDVWGTDVYTSNTNIGAAAVHAGLLNSAETGWIRSESVAPPPRFEGSARNGVTSQPYDAYPIAVKLTRVEGPAPRHRLKVIRETQAGAAPALHSYGPRGVAKFVIKAPKVNTPFVPATFEDRIGTRLLLKVKGQNGGRVWGTGTYTGDSDLATAAVHAGLVKVGETAWICREAVASPARFDGSENAEVTSMSFGSWPTAFKLSRGVGPAPRPPEPDALTLFRRPPFLRSPTSFADMIGVRVAVQVTGTSQGDVWGSDPYTNDSNIPTAAVHAGLLKVGETAWILRETVPAPELFVQATRNGVTSQANHGFPVAMKLSRLSNADLAKQFVTQILLEVTGEQRETVWGADIYTADSSIAAAAVHAGLIQIGQTAWVVCESVPAPARFDGLTRNGVTSQPCEKYDIAYRIRLAENSLQAQEFSAPTSPAFPEPTSLPKPSNAESQNFVVEPPKSRPAPIMVKIVGPNGMKLEIADLRGQYNPELKFTVPARLALVPGRSYRLRFSEIPNRPGLIIHPHLKIFNSPSLLLAAKQFPFDAISLDFSDEDLDAVYSATPMYKLVAIDKDAANKLSMISTVENQTDAIAKSRKPGALPLCVVRLRHHDDSTEADGLSIEKQRELLKQQDQR